MMVGDLLTSFFLLLGAGFTFVGSLALAVLPDPLSRLHGPTKATTLGVGSILIASSLFFASRGSVSLHELLIALFLFLTAPVSAHMIGRSALALHRRTRAPLPEPRLGHGPGEKWGGSPEESLLDFGEGQQSTLEDVMPDHVYKLIEIVGSSTEGTDAAIRNAVEKAGKTIRHLDWFEVVETRGHIKEGQVRHYQVKLKIGFRLEEE